MKSIFTHYAIAAVIVTVVACSVSDDGGECAEPQIASGITGIASIEAGSLRVEHLGVESDGSGGEEFLLFEPLSSVPIAKAELAIRVTYQIDSIGAAIDKGWIWQPSLFRSAFALSCLPASQQVEAAITKIEISPLANDSAPVIFEQAAGVSGDYITPDAGIDTAVYLQNLADGPVELQFVIDLRNATVENNVTELYVSVTTDDGGVFMQSTGELVWSE